MPSVGSTALWRKNSQPELEIVDQNEEDAEEEEGSYSSDDAICREYDPFGGDSQPELENVDQNEEDAREEAGSYSIEEHALCRGYDPLDEEQPIRVRECRSK